MTDARIIPFETGARKRRLRIEIEDWRARLRLAYERNWDARAKALCKEEIRRLDELARAPVREIS